MSLGVSIEPVTVNANDSQHSTNAPPLPPQSAKDSVLQSPLNILSRSIDVGVLSDF